MSVTARRFTALACLVFACTASAGVGAVDEAGVTGIVRVAGQPQKDVVVWLERLDPAHAARERVTMDQRNLTFSPRVLAVRVGTSVTMPNNDKVFHNVFSFRDGKRFDLGLYPVGQSRRVTFDRPGVSRIFCNIHPNMTAYVVAVDSDYYGVSNAAGVVTMAAVPPGAYAYHAWRAGHEPVAGHVSVSVDRRMEFDLP